MEEIKYNDVFEPAVNYPDPDFQARLGGLVGLDDYKLRLTKLLGILINRARLKTWADEHHKDATSIVETVFRRPPLIVLEGDVGSGKSELAVTIGDAVARLEKIDITLLPMSLSSRGDGMVGQMTKLISWAFEHTVTQAQKLKTQDGPARGGIILLIDEADALAQSRESSQMHHEDKAGVNAFIRGIDRLGNGKLPAVVIMCTNRVSALDPAIKRRAAEIFTFSRPNDEQRMAVLQKPLKELGLGEKDIESIVKLTGLNADRGYGLTYSDLMQRLLPSIVLDAYPDKPVTASRAIEIAKGIIPTPPFNEQ